MSPEVFCSFTWYRSASLARRIADQADSINASDELRDRMTKTHVQLEITSRWPRTFVASLRVRRILGRIMITNVLPSYSLWVSSPASLVERGRSGRRCGVATSVRRFSNVMT
jgi:hypothetical protein